MPEGGIVIVGSGMAGYGAAREFRKSDRAILPGRNYLNVLRPDRVRD